MWNDIVSYTSCDFFSVDLRLLCSQRTLGTFSIFPPFFFQPSEKINGAWMFHENALKKAGKMELSSSKERDWSEPSWQLRLLRSVDRPSAIWRLLYCRANFLRLLLIPGGKMIFLSMEINCLTQLFVNYRTLYNGSEAYFLLGKVRRGTRTVYV